MITRKGFTLAIAILAVALATIPTVVLAQGTAAAPTATDPVKEAQKAAQIAAADDSATKAKARIDASLAVQKAQIEASYVGVTDPVKEAQKAAQIAVADDAATKTKAKVDADLAVRKAQIEVGFLGGSSTSPSTAGETDPVFRSFLLGLSQYYGLDHSKILALLRSSKPGTSKEAIGLIEAARQKKITDATLADPRLKDVITAGVSGGIDAYFKANPLPTLVTDEHITSIADDRIDAVVAPIRGQVEAVAANAAAAGDLALDNAVAITAVKGGHLIIGGGGLSSEARKNLVAAIERYAASRNAAAQKKNP